MFHFGLMLCVAAGPLPPGAEVESLTASPARVVLDTPYAYSQLRVTANLKSGEEVDVTRAARLVAPAGVAAIDSRGLVSPAADGQGVIRVAAAGRTLDVPVSVTNQAKPHRVSFARDVMPAMSKMGCNAGTCHGAKDGKNGFKLSLRGYDPLFDHRSLTDDLTGRRFSRAAPDRSLMLLKPTGEVPHVGGALMQPGSREYRLIKEWIAQGVKLDLEAPRVESITVTPADPTVPRVGQSLQMTVTAKYTDGSTRDVSAEAFVESSNTEVAKVDGRGLVSTVRRGEATMLARFEGKYAASTVIVMGDRSGFEWAEPPAYNWIDELVYNKLKRIKVLPSGLCTDEEFVRRVYLDLTGLPPTPDQVRRFAGDGRPSRAKRDELIDRLIGNPEFVEHWSNKWADLLQVNRKFLGVNGAKALRAYVREAVRVNKPYDKFVYDILTASGSTVTNPAAGYYKVLRTPDEVMENTTQLFLAIRFNCNKCHDHPFERWTQDQYYNLAAYFARVGRKEDPKFKGRKLAGTAVQRGLPEVEVIFDRKAGEVKHDRTGETAPPEFPYDFGAAVDPKASRRGRLARWLTSAANPYFAKSYVNRIWSYLLGVGLIEPVDDIRAGNPPSNPELLDRLTRSFVDSGFDTRRLIRTICRSRTYQLSIETNRWNGSDALNYSHATARRLPAEVLYDAIHRVTGSETELPGLPGGARAASLLDSNRELPGAFLKQFGKPARESACECERTDSVMLGPVLTMINGPVVADAVQDPNNALPRLAAKFQNDGRLVEEIFMRVLNRGPTAAERAAGVRAVRSGGADHKLLNGIYGRRLKQFREYEARVDARQPAWERREATKTPWQVLKPGRVKSRLGARLLKQPDGSVFVRGKTGKGEEYTVTYRLPAGRVTSIRLEAMRDGRLPRGGPGRSGNGNFVLNELAAFVAGKDTPRRLRPVHLHRPAADYSQGGFPVERSIDMDLKTGWAVMGQTGRTHQATFGLAEPITVQAGATLTAVMKFRYPDGRHNIGRFRLAVADDATPSFMSVDCGLLRLLRVPAAKRTPAQRAALRGRHRATEAGYGRMRAGLGTKPPADPRVLGAQDLMWALINSPAFMFNH